MDDFELLIDSLCSSLRDAESDDCNKEIQPLESLRLVVRMVEKSPHIPPELVQQAVQIIFGIIRRKCFGQIQKNNLILGSADINQFYAITECVLNIGELIPSIDFQLLMHIRYLFHA